MIVDPPNVLRSHPRLFEARFDLGDRVLAIMPVEASVKYPDVPEDVLPVQQRVHVRYVAYVGRRKYHSTLRTQDATHLGNHPHRVANGNVLQYFREENGVETAILERQRVGFDVMLADIECVQPFR